MRGVRSVVAMLVCLAAAGPGAGVPEAWARPKAAAKKSSAVEVGSDRTIEKQSAWEQKVMGDDGGKRADMKKIAAAQRLGDEARKNPPPEPPKKHKDPNKEGARAKSEAAIGLPVASDEKAPPKRASVPAASKKTPHGDSANDELGALVATSLADDRKGRAPAPSASPAARTGNAAVRGPRGRGKHGKAAAAPPAPSSLDRMFSAGAAK